ncbi:hypothetical protein QZH41_011437, partial [Actinostola sp. cb2023]
MIMQTTDTEYEPTTSDDCFSSPEKIDRIPLPYEAYRIQKRIKIIPNCTESIQLPQKYHIAMTSQLEDFVDEINMTRSCTAQERCL